ncbi:MAG: hypothetical protein CMF39_05705 [Legionellaceae bacterium]|nr:hypothetical protein [Legionellaceae bacterium]
MKNNLIENIEKDGQLLAMIVRSSFMPDQTTFLTSDGMNQQIGYIVRSKDGLIDPHMHQPTKRLIVGTTEVLLVKKGVVDVDIYSMDRKKIVTKRLEEGDIILLNVGGHGFRIIEDAVLVEVKQGPYVGESDKQRF